MRAITVSSYGARPSVTELPTPQAGPGQVLIATGAAGMNPMDMQIAGGGWQDLMPAQFPMVLGADLAGTVREDGPGAARFAPGDAVFGQLLIPPLGSAGRMTSYGAAETIDRAAMPLPDAVARTHPDGIDVLVDVASDAGQFAALAGHVRPGGTALTTSYVADPQTLAQAGVTGVNFALPMTVPLLDRLASRVAAGSIVPPPITRVRLDDVPAVLGRQTEGKTVITM